MLATDPPVSVIASSLFTSDCTSLTYTLSWLDSIGNFVPSIPSIFSFDGDTLAINPGDGPSGIYQLKVEATSGTVTADSILIYIISKAPPAQVSIGPPTFLNDLRNITVKVN